MGSSAACTTSPPNHGRNVSSSAKKWTGGVSITEPVSLQKVRCFLRLMAKYALKMGADFMERLKPSLSNRKDTL